MNFNNDLKIISPLTGGFNCKEIKKYKVAKIIKDWEKNFNIDLPQEMFGFDQYSLFLCEDTGLKFFVPPGISGAAILYEKLQKFDWYYMEDKWEHRFALSRFNGKERILEVGSGKGAFVNRCMRAGFSVEGIEMNRLAVTSARKNGIPVHYLNLSEIVTRSPSEYDVVCSFQVLEHLADPKAFIELCLSALKQHGRLIFGVPNGDGFLKYQDNLLDMPPHHMTQWDSKVFRNLESIFPIKLAKIAYEPLAQYHIEMYLNTMQKIAPKLGFINRVLFSKNIVSLFRTFLQHGGRRFIRGHSMYVEYRKVT